MQMRIYRITLPFLILLLLIWGTGSAQLTPVKFNIQHFGEDEGIPQNSINCIFHDQNDFLWIGTEGGIIRFNGNRFVAVRSGPNVPITNFTRVKGFFAKGKDTILAYSSSSGSVAVIVNNTIIKIEPRNNFTHGFLFSNLHESIRVPGYMLNDSLSNYAREWDLSHGSYIGTRIDESSFIITVGNGIATYDSKGLRNKIVIPSFDPFRLLYVNKTALYLDPQNNLVLYAGTSVKKFLMPIHAKSPLKVYNDYDQKSFYCSADSVLYRVVPDNNGHISVVPILNNLQRANEITVIFEKDSNTVVAGTTTNGIYVYKRQFFHVSEQSTKGDFDVFYSQLLYPDGQTILTGKEKLFRNDHFVGYAPRSFLNNSYTTLKDAQGNYWYVLNNYLLRTKSPGLPPDTFYHYKGHPGIIYQDRHERVWVANPDTFGYFQNDLFHPVNLRIKNQLRTVSCMEERPDGGYVIGTANGLASFDDETGAGVKMIPGTASMEVRYVLTEQNGIVWICTYGQGLFLLTKDGITAYPHDSHKMSFIHCIIARHGLFWMPTNNGLFVTTRESLLSYAKNKEDAPFFYQFTKKDGLRTNEFNGGGFPAWVDLPGENISLPAMQGLVRFVPESVPLNFSSSPILLESISLDTVTTDEQKEIEVGNNINNVSFLVSTAFWGEKENDLLEYRVLSKDNESLGNDWLPVEPSGRINIFSPSHGNYELIVRKRSGLGNGDFIYKKVAFHVMPKWYQTKLFYVLLVLGILLAMIGIWFWRRNYYRRVNKINYQLNERVKELTTLYKAGVILQGQDRPITVTLNDFVNILPAGWQYPDITAASVKVGELEFHTPGFKTSLSSQSASFSTSLGIKGKVEVVYLEERPSETEGPFLAEERKLIDMLADMLRVYLNRRESGDALQKSEANLHTIFDTTDTVYVLLDVNCKIITFNQSAVEYGRKELKRTFQPNTDFAEYFPDDRKPRVKEYLARVLKGERISFETQFLQPDGSYTWYFIRLFSITNADKIEFGLMIAISDITEKKLLEQEILDQKAEEQKMVIRAILTGEERERNKIGQELHDNVNQILAGTKLYLGIAKSKDVVNKDIIKESITLIDNAMEELRTLSRGKVTPGKSIDLRESLGELLRSMSAGQFRTHFDYIGTDKGIGHDLKQNIYRIIQEQLNNIIKHAEAKNVYLKVQVNENGIAVQIRDDGMGFEPQLKKSGIGLSNMINRAESFNGKLDITSSAGNGCIVDLWIPSSS